MIESWSDVLSQDEKIVLSRAGMDRDAPLGKTPGLLVVDAQYSFVGEKKTLLESTSAYPKSSGVVAWQAVTKIRELIDAFHEYGYPVFYTKSIRRDIATGASVKATKSNNLDGPNAEEIVSEIAPTPKDIVVEKMAASGFHGTSLVRILNALRVDTLVVTGGTTSGCVRASVVDAFSYGYSVVVVPEGVFDRLRISHRASLLDMRIKYANLMNLKETLEYLAGCGMRPTPLVQRE